MTSLVPPLFRHLCDDAAIFPPGSAPLPQAVAAHDRHLGAPYGDLVGPLVVSAAVLPEIAGLVAGRSRPLALVVTCPDVAAIAGVAATVADLAGVQCVGLEVPLSGADPTVGLGELTPYPARGIAVSVEIPRFVDLAPEVRARRRESLLDELAGSGLAAKFRTGGVVAEAHPADAELAHAIVAATSRGLRFKATAGLHHLVRAVDPASGFDQHGFGNLLLATDLGLRGGSVREVADVLAVRDQVTIAARLGALDDATATRVRERFVSFGTCSITDPLADLVAAGLLAPYQEETR